MLDKALNIILRSKDWIEFVSELENLGSAPEYKKLKGDAFEQLTKYHLKTDPLYSSMFKNVFIVAI